MKEDPPKKLSLPHNFIIQGSVVARKKVSPQAMIILGHLVGLSTAYGYCWASTEHLAENHGLSARQVYRCLSELEKANYIRREVQMDPVKRKTPEGTKIGLKKVRKIFINHQELARPIINKCFEGDINGSFLEGDINGSFLEGDINGRYNRENIYEKNKKKKNEPKGSTDPEGSVFSEKSSSSKKEKKPEPELISRGEYLKVSEEEHQKLLDKYGKEHLDECYALFDNWLSGKSPKARRVISVTKHIAQWVNNQVIENKANKIIRESKVAYAEKLKNSMYAPIVDKGKVARAIQHMADYGPFPVYRKKVMVGQDYLEIVTGGNPGSRIFDFKDREFLAKLIHFTKLSKWNDAAAYLEGLQDNNGVKT